MKIRYETWYWGKYVISGSTIDGSVVTENTEGFEEYKESEHGAHQEHEFHMMGLYDSSKGQ